MSPIRYLAQGYSKLAEFSGTSCRREFWWLFAANTGLLILSVQLTILFPSVANLPLIGLGLATFIFGNLSSSVRRLRDARRSPLWLLAPPIATFFLMQSTPIEPTPSASVQLEKEQGKDLCKLAA